MGSPPPSAAAMILSGQKNTTASENTTDAKTSPDQHSSHNNGFNKIPPILKLSDVEMTAIQSESYTSLKDLLPPPSILSPPNTRNSSWDEIPIKNPLVKHAALAYLQPMSTPTPLGDKGFFRRFKDQFCAQCGCFGWFRDVVLKPLRSSFCQTREEDIQDDDDDDDDEDEDQEKLD